MATPIADMGYACPVCDAPQADGEHLANHVAFTALLHGDDHEAWLDRSVPDWAERDPEGLAAAVTQLAEEIEADAAIEDASTGEPGFDHGHVHRFGGYRDLDPETRRVLEEAMELTRQRRSGDGAEE